MHKKLLKFLFTISSVTCIASSQAQTISITASTSDTICSGTSVTYTAAASGGTHYQWTKNSVVLSGATLSTYTTSALATGDVIVCELLNSAGGTIIALSNPKVMTVESMPVVAAISGSDTVCRLATTTLSDATAGGVWNTSNPFITSVTSTGFVTALAAGLDTITYSVSNSCGSDTARMAMYVNTPPFLAPITGPATICLGNSATYTDSPAIGTWHLSSTLMGSITTAGLVNATGVGVDTVLYSATNSCGTTTRRRPVAFQTAPVVPPISGSSTVCQGDTLHLRDGFPGGNWHSQNTSIADVIGAPGGGPGGALGILRGNAGGTVTVVYVSANACGVDSATFSVVVNPLPVVYPIIGRDSICAGSTESLFEYSTGGTWTSQNSSIATVDASGNVTAIAAGVDTIYYSVSNDCGTVTQALPIAIYCPHNVGVPVVSASAEVSIFPNPAHDILSIQDVNAALVQIVNVYGQTVSSIRNTNSVSISNLAEGIYFITVFNENGAVVTKQRIVKM